MNGRTTLGVAAGALTLAALAAIPALDMTAPAPRDRAEWIEVADPPAAMLALPTPADDGIVAPVLEERLAPAPAPPAEPVRDPLASALTTVPSAPPLPSEPAAPILADAGTAPSGFELPALESVAPPFPIRPDTSGRTGEACCPSWRTVAC